MSRLASTDPRHSYAIAVFREREVIMKLVSIAACAATLLLGSLLFANAATLAQITTPPDRYNTPLAPVAAAAPNVSPLPPEASPATLAVTTPAPLIAPVQLAEFVDGVVRAYMGKDGLAGVTVAVVDRNSDLLLRGYGNAAFDPPRDVDPASTLFRIGSISKTFTYIATMQLVGQGKLQLDAPINNYLPEKLKLIDDGHTPIKLWHLLSHTAGFEDSALGHLFKKSSKDVLSLDDYLTRYRPQRVREPETHAVYSNYSVALLGAIVAHVSGEPFEAYVEQHILAPLGMQHTTFREPLPANDTRHVDASLATAWSSGFHRTAGGFKTEPFEYISAMSPAGGGSSTAADMARYMRMLLHGGSLDGKTILPAAGFDELGKITYRNGDKVGGIAHGFFRIPYGRYESLEHGGATLYFLSDMVVLPDAGVAVFVSTNTDSGREFATTLPRLIFEHFLPDARPTPLPQPAKDFNVSGQRFVGSYQSQRRNYSTLEKFFTAIDSVVDVGITADGYLLLSDGAQAKRYVQEGALSFRSVESDQHIQFFADVTGRITGLSGAYGNTYFDRIGVLDAPSTFAQIMALLALTCIGVLLCVWRRRALPMPRSSRRGAPSAVAALVTATLTWLAFLGASLVTLAQIAAGGSDIVFDYPTTALRVTVALAYGAAGLTVLAVVLWPSIWKVHYWSFWRKLRHTLGLLIMLASIAMLWHWNVLGAHLAAGQ
jgi:CubicO group peptidase (beta-lactamase class C family)